MPCTTACPIPGQLRCPRVPINPPSPRVRGWGLRGRAGRPALTEVKSCRTGAGAGGAGQPRSPSPAAELSPDPPRSTHLLGGQGGLLLQEVAQDGQVPAGCSLQPFLLHWVQLQTETFSSAPRGTQLPASPRPRPSTHGHGAGAHAAAPILGCLPGVLLAVLLARLWLRVRAVPARGALAQAQQGKRGAQ